MKIRLTLMAVLALGSLSAAAQDKGNDKGNSVSVHGSVQVEALVPEDDPVIGTKHYKEHLLGNVYANAGLFSKYVDAGVRFEYLDHPLPGFDLNKGWGVPNVFVKGRLGGVEVTLGDYYEQFGSGFILRTYEDRALGIDNSLRGARVKVNSLKGFRFTALGGLQRRFWDWSFRSKVFGADAEVDLQQYIKSLSDKNISWNFGASYVLKHEKDEEKLVSGPARLNFPKNVSAFDVRTHFYRNGLDLKAEYAWKSQDPSYFNNYTYRHGSAVMLSAAYSAKGYSMLLQAKRSDNMSFRSQRSEEEAASWLNNMPPFNYMHTYTLAAHYPYATQDAPGEWAFQGDFSYLFKRKTALGGKYGTKVRLNASYICAIDRTPLSDNKLELPGTDWWQPGGEAKLGGPYYLDVNLQIEKKFTRDFTLNFMYMFQKYNKTALEGHGGMVNSNIFVADGKFRLSKKFTLRAELQYLTTRQDEKDWAFGLLELSYSPWLMFTVSDEWNCGGSGNHYYTAGVTGNYRNNRLYLGYVRTRAGFNCAGGVCRYMPATRGLQLTYSYNF